MIKLLIKLYNFFENHRAALYAIMAGTALVFAFFASKLHFEENIATLLPKTDKSRECSVAFSNIKIKDKLFVQVTGAEGCRPDAKSLASGMDEFMNLLHEGDTDNEFIGNCLYRIDTDDLMNLLYYGMGALPCHLGEGFYTALDTLLSEKAIDDLVSGKNIPEMPVAFAYSVVDGHVFSPDSTIALAFIEPKFSSLDTKAGNEFETLIASKVEAFEKAHPECKVLYHGAVVEGTFNSRQIKKDLFWTVGISLLLICLIIGISFKDKRTLVNLVAPVIYGALFAMACVFWIKGSLSIIALGIGAIVLGVALSYCLHILTHHKFVGDPETVIKEQAKPVFLGCLTTIGAFAGLLFTSSELLKDFGLFASFSLIGTTFYAIVFLPHFLKKGQIQKNEKVFNIINKINSYPLDRNRFVVAALAILAVVCIFTSKKVGFDSDLAHIGYREPKMVESEQLYNKKVAGSGFSMYYAAHADNLDSAIIYSRNLIPVLDSLKEAGAIVSWSGTNGILIPYDEQQANISRWKKYWTKRRVERAYNLLVKEAKKHGWKSPEFDIPETFKLMAEADYEPQSFYDAGVVPDALMCNFVEQNADGWLVFTTVNFNRDKMKEVNAAIGAVPHIIVLDPFFYTGDMVEIVHSDFNFVLLFSSVFVFIVLLLSFRNIIISIIAFLPMMLSWYIVQGLMAIFGIEFNLINIMISTFIFGIGVDYSIFVMDGLINKAKYGSHRLLICHKAAIFLSAVALLIVTASLLFAIHPAIYSIGISTIIGMSSTILITYAIQPLLFKLVMKNKWIANRITK